MAGGQNEKIVFDGQVYAQRMTGQYRYANELLRELDKLVSKDEYELVIPDYVALDEDFKNIRVVHYGNVKGLLWSQTSLARHSWSASAQKLYSLLKDYGNTAEAAT